MGLKLFSYSFFQFVPAVGREEAVNLGVVVISDAERRSLGRFLPGLGRKIAAVAPGANMRHIREATYRLRQRFDEFYQPTIYGEGDARVTSSSQLRALAASMAGQLQLTEPRRYRASSITAAADELFADFVLPIGRQTATPRAMTRSQVGELIRKTIRNWAGQVTVQEGEAEGHYADFWLRTGEPQQPLAALIAIPEDPFDLRDALALCDSIPTIARVYRQINPRFRAVAVLPPAAHEETDFVRGAKKRLRDVDGVLVARADELNDYRDELLPGALALA